ncbi:hypothetical protein DRN80_04750 [Methanosarcinales archaeon]|nr:MAG: hypothetical protein DRN80_04750 [Methanosarcinales archaeon]
MIAMVIAGKLFMIEGGGEGRWKGDIALPRIASKLKDYRREDKEQDIRLITEIKDLHLTGDLLSGTFVQDELMGVYHHGELIHVPRTLEAPFFFVEQPDKHRVVLTIMEKKTRANNIANQLSKILFMTTSRIVEARIEPSRFVHFHEDNFEDTKVIFFDDVDIPNVKKLSLYGSALADTSLYAEHLKHGKIWYIVLKSRRYGLVVGLTRNGVVTIFSKATKDDFINYVRDEVISLV